MLEPLFNNVLLKMQDKKSQTDQGIYIPDAVSQDQPPEGEVVAVGAGKRKNDGTFMPMCVKVGDKVVFKKYSPDELEMDGEKVLIVSEEDILGIIR